MKLKRSSLIIAVAVILLVSASVVMADTITQNTSGPLLTGVPAYFGQSFITPSGGPWSQITFNFYSDVPATTPAAVGTGFLLSQEYLDTPANLSSSAPGFIALTTGVSAGVYVFDPLLVLQPGTLYFFYENEIFAAGTASGGNQAPITSAYWVFGSNPDFVYGEGIQTNYAVSGSIIQTPVPEPCSLLLLATGLMGVALATWGGRR